MTFLFPLVAEPMTIISRFGLYHFISIDFGRPAKLQVGYYFTNTFEDSVEIEGSCVSCGALAH